MIDPGFFSYKYEVYVLKVQSLGTVVERRFSDFTDLRAIYKKLYPGYVLPALPKKTPRKLDPDTLKKYRVRLQVFIDEVMRHPFLRATEITSKFVAEKDPKEYEAYKSMMEKAPAPKAVSQCYTVEGTANVACDPVLESECGEIRTGNKNIQQEFQTSAIYFL